MTEQVLVEARDGVQIITINRPEAKNALNLEVATAVAAAIDELDASDDLRVGESPAIEGRGLCGITQTPPRKPLIGAVEGWALAGGFELLLACDLVVASEAARFGVPEVKRSLVAGGGAALLLAKRVAPALALELLLTGDPIDAARAAEIGLVNRVAPEGGALDVALDLAGAIAANGPLAVAATKAIAKQSADWSFTDGWREQDAIMMPVFSSADAREGARAFAEKRPPVWTGR
jgi:enoyl-CoA hydratase